MEDQLVPSVQNQNQVGEPIKLLIVEDELLIARILARTLKKLGYEVIDIVSSGEKAIEVATAKKPDLVLMDIVIKGTINGIEAATQIQSHHRIPTVYLTAYADNETLRQAQQSGGYGFIVKPFKEEQLNAAIQIALGQHKHSNTAWQLATTDPLTGILNRRYFFSQTEQEFERACRYGRPFSILMVDIDHFKSVNDTYGHAAGDEVIKATVKTVQELLRETDYFGRFGGEEFVVFLPETDLAAAQIVGERIVKSAAAHHIVVAGQTINITVSVGVTTYGVGDRSLSSVLERADQALYQAKREGRNQVITH